MHSDNPHQNNVPDHTTLLDSLQGIASAVMYAAEAGSLEQTLERIAQVAGQLVRARYAAVGVPDKRGGMKYFKVAGMTPEEIQRVGHLPVGRGLLGAIMHDRETLRLEDMHSDPRAVGFCPGHPDMTTLLGVPVQVGSQLFGALYLSDREDGQPFDDTDQQLVEALAGYAALAIAGAQLGEQQSKLTLLEERERIGMELHDGVIQSLYAIGMHLDLMRLNNNLHSGDLQPVINDLNSVIDDIRRYILNLKAGHERTVYGSLRQMVDRLHIPRHITVEINAPDQPSPFMPATFEAICQIVNEAMSNAVRHAHASRITISTQADQNLFQIVVADDGQGFDLVDVRHHDGLGLHNIQQRARLYGGQVNIETAPGEGTRLTITLPVR
jgi:signal transduction histidine kinase